jgi:hypothetical protein
MATKREILRKQRSHTMRARAQDALRTANNVKPRTDKEAVKEWMIKPGRSDLRGVDTRGNGASRHSSSKGWFEKKHPLTDKAPIHQKVALEQNKEEIMNMAKSSIIPHAPQDASFHLKLPKEEHSNFKKIAEKFDALHLDITSAGDEVTVEMPVEKIEDFVGFLADNGFELEDEEEKEIDEIIEIVQGKRTDSAVVKDNARTAKRVDDKEVAEDLKD